MSDKKKNLINGIFLLTVFVLTIYSVFSGEDLSDIADTISEASPVYLLMGVGCVIFFIWAESAILHYLLGTLGIKTKRRTCFLYSSVGFFFSCITPSAGGGQPAQVYYMRKNMIPVPVATVVLMVVTITYKSVLVVIGCLLAVFGQGFLNRYLYEVYIFAEPTVGVDVGAKSGIYETMRELAREAAVIIVSSDREEVLGNADRIMVVNQGRVTLSCHESETTLQDMLVKAASDQ
mgnify:CR=1 FL=1